MVSDSSEIKRYSHNVGQNWYHVVLIPAYRNPVFRQEHQRKLMLEALAWLCPRHKYELFAKEVMDDHVHLFLSCPQDSSIKRMIQIVKGGTSYYIRKHHPALKIYRAFWSKGSMFRSVGAISAQVVERYIKNSNVWQGGQRKLV